MVAEPRRGKATTPCRYRTVARWLSPLFHCASSEPQGPARRSCAPAALDYFGEENSRSVKYAGRPGSVGASECPCRG
eukprot:10977634-Alexandrium_andersonii.AAC.1